MAMTQSMIKLDHVSKQLGRQQVLDDLSLEVKLGEFLVIFGPSGVGKTTLLRLIAGVMQPDGGDIYLNQRLVTDVEPEFRDVAMAFQTFALYPHMNAFDNIASPLHAHGMEEIEIEHRVNDIAELLKIRHVLAHAPGALSNGQKQRTALARSLVREPSIVLLDDPLRNVDAKLRYEMRLELPQILHRYKATMVYVTQDFKEAMALGDRVAVLLDGKVRQIGTPEDIYRRPHDAQVAQLFGDPPINTISVQPTNGEDLEPFTVRLGGRDWPAPTCPKELVGHDCLMGLRPEDIIVFDAPTDDSVPMRLEAVLPLNVRTALALRSEEGTKLIATIWDVHADLDEAERRKQTFYAHLDLSHAVFFDQEHGRRL